MTIKYLPLYKDADYRFSMPLEGNQYNFRIYWVERSSAWYVDVSDSSLNSIREGVKLVPSYPLLENITPLLTGLFWLQPYTPETVYDNIDARQLSTYYYLVYSY